MQVRPFLASAACSAVAALALVLSEGAWAGAHLLHHAGGVNGSAPKSTPATASTFDNGTSPSGAFGGDPAAGSDSSTDQSPADQSSSGQEASGGGFDPGSLAQQLLPVPDPVPKVP